MSTREGVTRQRVIDAAAELVDATGLDSLNLTQVAAALKVRQSALYNHVSGVDDVRRALALEARRILADDLRNAAVGRSRQDAVLAIADAWRAFVKNHRGLYEATDRVPIFEDEELTAAVATIVTIIRSTISGYGLDDRTADEAAWSLRSAIHGFCILEADRGHPSGVNLDHAYHRLVTLLCSGMAQGSPGGGPVGD